MIQKCFNHARKTLTRVFPRQATNVEQVRLNQNNNYYVCYPFPWKESMSDPLEASSWRPPLGGLLLEAFSWTPPLEGLLLKASSWRFGGIQ